MRCGKILILNGQDFHVEDFREVVRGTGGTGALRPALGGVLVNRFTGDEIRNTVFSGNRNVQPAIDMFGVWKE